MKCHVFIVVVLLGASIVAAGTVAAPFGISCNVSAVLSTPAASVGSRWTLDAPSGGVWIPACSVRLELGMNRTGWDIIRVSPDRALLEDNYTAAYYACGYLEAVVTYADIINANASDISLVSPPLMVRWIEDQIAYLQSVRTLPEGGSRLGIGKPTVAAVKRFLPWLEGLTAGMNAALGVADAWRLFDSMLVNLNGELMDIWMVSTNGTMDPMFSRRGVGRRHRQRASTRGLHCSALVKVTVDDIFFAHDTWSTYNNMLRQFKTYDWEVSISMSSYPGLMSSADDYYRVSSGLLVTETSLDQYNTSLRQEYVVPHTTPEFMRVMAANLLASSGAEWTAIFLDNNSGTYNNQYMILDTKRVPTPFDGTQDLPAGTFWVLEQLPGPFSVYEDMTWFLNTHKY